MKKKPDTALYFTTLVVLQNDIAVMGGHLYIEEAYPSMTRFLSCNKEGKWRFIYDLDDVAYAITRKPNQSERNQDILCLLGRMGSYREITSNCPIVEAKLDITSAGYLQDIRCIGNHLHTCGVQNLLYRQDEERWVRMDQGIFSPLGKLVDRTLHSIDGFSENDIYAVGDSGFIWHWDGKAWIQLDSFTNLPLYCVLCASDGNVYIGGSYGTLFKGNRNKGWIDLTDHSVTDEVFEDMTEFQGKVYITATNVLLSTEGENIEQVEVPITGDKAYYAIDSNVELLWCVGDDCVLQFDGKNWKKHICPDNV